MSNIVFEYRAATVDVLTWHGAESSPPIVYTPRAMLRPTLALALGAWLVFESSVAVADPAAAEVLFWEGRALLERGELEAACGKLEASNALEPSSGTLLNLATCRLRQGKTATAWAHFVSAARVARAQNRREHLEEAERRRAELEPELATLTLQVANSPAGLQVRRNGSGVDPASFGLRIPVDPGDQHIEMSAPGYTPRTVDVPFGPNSRHVVVELPALSPISPSAAPTASARGESSPEAGGAHGPGALPWVIGGVGGAALVTGGIFGALAIASNSEALEQCGGRTTNCPSDARETARRRDREALVSSVGVGVGIVGLGVAVVWLLRAAPDARQTAWLNAEVTRDGALLGVRSGF